MSLKCDSCGRFARHLNDVWSNPPQGGVDREICDNCRRRRETPMSLSEEEWEAEVRIRRNGRCVGIIKALGDTAGDALYNVTNDLGAALHDNPTGRDAVAIVREECGP